MPLRISPVLRSTLAFYDDLCDLYKNWTSGKYVPASPTEYPRQSGPYHNPLTKKFDRADCFLSDLQDRLAPMTTAAERAAALAHFKYCEGCAAIANCPPDTHQKRSGTWFRIIYVENDEKSFLPPYKKDPVRLLEKPGACTDWALSLYITAAKARAQYRYLAKIMPDIDTRIGNHIASVTVSEEDGISSLPSRRSGHIDLHEFCDAKLYTKSTHVGSAALDG